jgi:DNA-binding transcriptional regulator LsrR (DeoR family)
MPEEIRPAELVLAASIARRFYLDGVSKVDIGQEFGISRFKVARILTEARERGLVRVDIRLPGSIDGDLSAALRDALGLRRVIVLDHPAEPEASLRQHLAEVTADLLAEIVVDGDVLGLTWSRTLEATNAALTRLAGCTVVQLAGTVARADRDTGTVEMVRRAAALGGGRAYAIYAPLVVPDAATAASLRGQPGIADALERFDALTKAVVSIGHWSPRHSTVWEAVSDRDRGRYRDLGACAEVSGRLFDAEGSALHTDLDDRLIAITVDQLRAVPEVVAISAGAGRARAVEAVVKAGFVTTLVTDATCARAILGDEADRAPESTHGVESTHGAKSAGTFSPADVPTSTGRG